MREANPRREEATISKENPKTGNRGVEMGNYLPEEKRQAIVAALGEEKAIREISRETGVARNTIKKIRASVAGKKEGNATLDERKC